MKKLIFLLLFLPLIVSAQLELPYSVKVLNPKPLDAKYFNTAGTAYTNTAQVISQLTSGLRYEGLTVSVVGVEYWFSGGIADGDLVVKTGGSSYTFENGLTETAGVVELGGANLTASIISTNGLDGYLTILTGDADGGTMAYGNILVSTGASGITGNVTLQSGNTGATQTSQIDLSNGTINVYSNSSLKATFNSGITFPGIAAASGQSYKVKVSDTGLLSSVVDAGGGTVTSVTSANADATVANTTTTPVITIVNSPKVGGITITGTPSVGQIPTATSGTAATWQTPSGVSGLTVGTSTITSGTSGNYLYNNAGVLGERTFGTGVTTWLTTPSWTNFNSAITGTAPFIKTSGTSLVGSMDINTGGSNEAIYITAGDNTNVTQYGALTITSNLSSGAVVLTSQNPAADKNATISVYNGDAGMVSSGTFGNFQFVLNQTGGVQLNLASNSTGDIYYRNSSGYLSRLAVGTNGQVLTLASGLPSWAASAGGMTNPLTTTGDIIQSSSGTTPARLASVATGNVLISGGVATVNSWGKVGLTTHVSGVLPVANGGTNASSASITAFNNITGYTASGATGTTSTNLVFSTSPTLITPVLGTPTSVTLTNATGLPPTTGISGWPSNASGVLTNNGSGTLTWGAGASGTLSGLTAATAGNTINNTNYQQEWQWSTLGAGSGLKLSSTSTAAASNTNKVFEVATSGANGTSTQTTYGGYFANTHTGTSSTNVGSFFTASGGTTNRAIEIGAGALHFPTGGTVTINSGNLTMPDVNFTGTPTISGSRLLLFNGGLGTIGADANSGLVFRSNASSTVPSGGYFRYFNTNGSYTPTSGELISIGNEMSFAPTSGTATLKPYKYSGTINQTGGANGQITTYSSEPTITAAVNVTGFYYKATNPSNISTQNLSFHGENGSMVLGSASLSASTVRADIAGIGTTTGKTLRLANSSGTERFYFTDAGIANVSVAPSNAASTSDHLLTRDVSSGDVEKLALGTGLTITSGALSLSGSGSVASSETSYITTNQGGISMGASGNGDRAIDFSLSYPNNTTLVVETQFMAMKSDGTAAAFATVTSMFRKDNSGTWTVDSAGTSVTSNATVIVSIAGAIQAGVPVIHYINGAFTGTYAGAFTSKLSSYQY